MTTPPHLTLARLPADWAANPDPRAWRWELLLHLAYHHPQMAQMTQSKERTSFGRAI